MSETENPKAGKLRIRDIAELAGVSTAAVSAVLNNRPKISSATKERVLQIIRKHNYVPQSAARALSGKKTFQIGFLLSCKVTLGLANNYYATMLSGVHDVCRSRGYHLVISTYDLSNINDFIMPANICQRNIDGLVLAGITDLAVIGELQKTQLPFIILDGHYPEGVLCVNNDEKQTSDEVLSFFYNLGHRKIVCPWYYPVTAEIYRASLKRLHEKNAWTDLEVFLPNYTESEFIAGERFAEEYFRMPEEERYTALCGTDQFCTGFLGKFIASGGRCPDDLSVLAPETPLSCYGIIRMSTIDNHLFELGRQAGKLLIDLLEGLCSFEEVKNLLHTKRNHTEIVIRNSTGSAKNSDFSNLI